jgi:hypothetical protein
MMSETNKQAEDPEDEKGPRDKPCECINGAIKSLRPYSIGLKKKEDEHRHEVASVAVSPT